VSAATQTAIVTDTTSYTPAELLREHDIHEISLYVSVDGEQQRESEITDYAGFYERLRSSAGGATTSQPSIGDFIEIYQPLLEAGHEIVSIHLSAGISGTWEAARQARQRLIEDGKGGERVHVYDSRTACGGMAILVLGAARGAADGLSPDQILDRVRSLREALELWFAVDTLEFLRKGGRIGGASAWLGTALQIKPILTLGEEITPVERVRTRRRAFERLVERARERHTEFGADAWIVQHIHDPAAAERFAEEGRKIYGTEPLFIGEIGPVIGAHIGPGLLGTGGVPPALLG
jgi:fatty acid kinase fatty acid binding subunit